MTRRPMPLAWLLAFPRVHVRIRNRPFLRSVTGGSRRPPNLQSIAGVTAGSQLTRTFFALSRTAGLQGVQRRGNFDYALRYSIPCQTCDVMQIQLFHQLLPVLFDG